MSVSQPARFGEDWSDERVASFLQRQAPDGIDPDYHVLTQAYRHMRFEDLDRFLTFFLDQKRHLQAVGPHGKTWIQDIQSHAAAQPLLQRLAERGLIS